MARKTHEQFVKEVYDAVGDEYTVLSEYTTNKAKVTFRHNTCEREVEIIVLDFLSLNICLY